MKTHVPLTIGPSQFVDEVNRRLLAQTDNREGLSIFLFPPGAHESIVEAYDWSSSFSREGKSIIWATIAEVSKEYETSISPRRAASGW